MCLLPEAKVKANGRRRKKGHKKHDWLGQVREQEEQEEGSGSKPWTSLGRGGGTPFSLRQESDKTEVWMKTHL